MKGYKMDITKLILPFPFSLQSSFLVYPEELDSEGKLSIWAVQKNFLLAQIFFWRVNRIQVVPFFQC